MFLLYDCELSHLSNLSILPQRFRYCSPFNEWKSGRVIESGYRKREKNTKKGAQMTAKVHESIPCTEEPMG